MYRMMRVQRQLLAGQITVEEAEGRAKSLFGNLYNRDALTLLEARVRTGSPDRPTQGGHRWSQRMDVVVGVEVQQPVPFTPHDTWTT